MSRRNEEEQVQSRLRRNVILDRVAMLCLIKFMCVSSQVCKKNLDLIFNMLDSNADAIVKTNILIGIGDLYHRYPNILERYLHLVYKSLSDTDTRVRKTCLMVITHLVLNDMLKVKAEISSIAILIDDSDIRYDVPCLLLLCLTMMVGLIGFRTWWSYSSMSWTRKIRRQSTTFSLSWLEGFLLRRLTIRCSWTSARTSCHTSIRISKQNRWLRSYARGSRWRQRRRSGWTSRMRWRCSLTTRRDSRRFSNTLNPIGRS